MKVWMKLDRETVELGFIFLAVCRGSELEFVDKELD